MGYECDFKIVGELDEQFKTWSTTTQDLNEYKTMLVAICMLNREKSSVYVHAIYKEVATFTNLYFSVIEDSWKFSLKKELEKDNNVHFCGWEFSSRGDGFDEDEYENYKNRVIQNLVYIAINDCPSVMEDSGKYFEKIRLIEEELVGIEEVVYDTWNHKLFDFYKDKDGSEFNESY